MLVLFGVVFHVAGIMARRALDDLAVSQILVRRRLVVDVQTTLLIPNAGPELDGVGGRLPAGLLQFPLTGVGGAEGLASPTRRGGGDRLPLRLLAARGAEGPDGGQFGGRGRAEGDAGTERDGHRGRDDQEEDADVDGVSGGRRGGGSTAVGGGIVGGHG